MLAKLKIFFIAQNPDTWHTDFSPPACCVKNGAFDCPVLWGNPEAVICVDWDKSAAKPVKLLNTLKNLDCFGRDRTIGGCPRAE